MPCYHPVNAWKSTDIKNPKTGKSYIFHFKKPGRYIGFDEFKRPCGLCRGCRHEHARQWAVRICHEASLYPGNNSFITLTFDDKRHKYNKSLEKETFKKFMKRLRKHYFGSKKGNIRYFHCGEYGERFQRPHHHAILFNHTFKDKYFWKYSKQKQKLYRSPILEKLWKLGDSTIGDVNYDTAAYVARYVVKKIGGKMAPDHYQGRLPEYTSMSLKPGIAREWYEKYKNTDVFPKDYIVLNGRKGKVPKYYDTQYELTNPEDYAILKSLRQSKAEINPNNDPDRLKAAEKMQYARDAQTERSYEASLPGV